VTCSDLLPFASRDAVQAEAARYPAALSQAGVVFNDTHFDICATWTTAPPNPLENQPVVSAIPTLILAGEYDPVTPPSWGQLAADTLANAHFFEVSGTSHGVLFANPCAAGIARDFLDAPLTAPDAACIANQWGPEFIIREEVSIPWTQAAVVGLVAVTLVAAGHVGRALLSCRYHPAWRMSTLLLGWLPTGITIAALALLILFHESGGHIEGLGILAAPYVVGVVIPLSTGIL
jgi:hypothetical protein